MARRVALSDFNAWSMPGTWSVRQDEDHSVSELIHQLYRHLAEHANDDWTEADFKDRS